MGDYCAPDEPFMLWLEALELLRQCSPATRAVWLEVTCWRWLDKCNRDPELRACLEPGNPFDPLALRQLSNFDEEVTLAAVQEMAGTGLLEMLNG